jgi:hypothetical protein
LGVGEGYLKDVFFCSFPCVSGRELQPFCTLPHVLYFFWKSSIESVTLPTSFSYHQEVTQKPQSIRSRGFLLLGFSQFFSKICTRAKQDYEMSSRGWATLFESILRWRSESSEISWCVCARTHFRVFFWVHSWGTSCLQQLCTSHLGTSCNWLSQSIARGTVCFSNIRRWMEYAIIVVSHIVLLIFPYGYFSAW